MSLCLESSARMFSQFQGIVEMRKLYPVVTEENLINLQWRRKSL